MNFRGEDGCRNSRGPEYALYLKRLKKEREIDARMISNFVTGDIPVRNERVVGVSKRSEISHRRSTSVGIFALGEELVDGIQSVRLDGVVGREHNKLRDIRLQCGDRRKGVSARYMDVSQRHRSPAPRRDGTHGVKATGWIGASTVTIRELTLASIARVSGSIGT